MNRTTFWNSLSRCALPVLFLGATLTVVACGNEVNFSPARPTFSDLTTFPNATLAGTGRNLEILGSLTAEQGSCLEATILYDGQELAGARALCRDGSGCAKVELAADVRSTSGHHTISFQVLSQRPESVIYVAEGAVLVSRAGIPMVMTIDLEPTRTTLRSGESVTFEVDFLNFVK